MLLPYAVSPYSRPTAVNTIFTCPFFTLLTTGMDAKLIMIGGVDNRLRCTAYLKKWRHGIFFTVVLMTYNLGTVK
jgi:hypothetical protein